MIKKFREGNIVVATRSFTSQYHFIIRKGLIGKVYFYRRGGNLMVIFFLDKSNLVTIFGHEIIINWKSNQKSREIVTFFNEKESKFFKRIR